MSNRKVSAQQLTDPISLQAPNDQHGFRSDDWHSHVGDKGNVFYIAQDCFEADSKSKLLPIGSTHEALLFVDPVRNRSRYGDTECEKLFGIIPAKFSKPSGEGVYKSFVRVAAVVPGSEVSYTQIRINDWLMCVNDLEVTWENLNSILSAINSPKQIRLTLQKMIPENRKMLLTQPVGVYSFPKPHTPHNASDDPENYSNNLTVMYLTLDSSEGSGNDLIYCFPSRTKERNKLVAVRGMFLTLSSVMADISKHPANISSVTCEGRLVNIAYSPAGRELLVMAVPSDFISANELLTLLSNSTQCLKFMFGSLHSAFTDFEEANRIDLFFTLVSQHISNNTPSQTVNVYIRSRIENFYESMDKPVCLQLPDEALLNVNNTLSEFEAADFGDMGDDYYEMRRAYTILGVCLFYKGYLVANHLPTEDLKDITIFANHYNILAGSRISPIGGSLIWQEIFPSRRREPDPSKIDPYFVEASGRWFLLIVANRHSVMAVILEAGGCSAKALGYPIADTFYVNQARQTLKQLETFDFSLICEARLQTTKPPLTSIENLMAAPPNTLTTVTKDFTGLLSRAGNTASDILKRATGSTKSKTKHFEQATSSGFVSMIENADGEVQSYGSGNSGSFKRSRNMSTASTGSADSINSANQLYEVRSNRSHISADVNSGWRDSHTSVNQSQSSTDLTQNSFILTSGTENTLFCYVNFDSILGVILSPTIDELQNHSGDMNKQLLSTFFSTCNEMMATFESQEEKDPSNRLYELGVLLQINKADNSNKPISFWVVGRALGKDADVRILFVCFHESVPENMVDLAFKINTGFRI